MRIRLKANDLMQKEGSHYIWDLYRQLLNRLPQKEELIHSQIQLSQGISKIAQIQAILTSPQAAYLYQTPLSLPITPHSTIADLIRTFYTLPITDFINHAYGEITNAVPPNHHQSIIEDVTVGKMSRLTFISHLFEESLQNKKSPQKDLNQRMMEIEELVSPIDGWLTTKEGAALYNIARFHAPIPTVVEVGSFKGRSTSWLSFAVKDRGGGTIYAVDHWQNWGQMSGIELYQSFIHTITSLNLLPFVKPIQSDTIEAANKWPLDQEIGFLFIDAVHDYHSVRRDFEFWSPKVKEGGFIAFHDVDTWDGVTKLVEELPRWIKKINQADSVWIGQKITP